MIRVCPPDESGEPESGALKTVALEAFRAGMPTPSGCKLDGAERDRRLSDKHAHL